MKKTKINEVLHHEIEVTENKNQNCRTLVTSYYIQVLKLKRKNIRILLLFHKGICFRKQEDRVVKFTCFRQRIKNPTETVLLEEDSNVC